MMKLHARCLEMILLVNHPSMRLGQYQSRHRLKIYIPGSFKWALVERAGIAMTYWIIWADPVQKLSFPPIKNLQVGDVVPMSPDGKQGLWVKDFRDNEWMLWWDKKGDSTWAWGIYPEGEAYCRLVTRVRVKYRWLSPAILFNLLIEFFDIWMMIKCMKGIKRRAEAWYGNSKTEA